MTEDGSVTEKETLATAPLVTSTGVLFPSPCAGPALGAYADEPFAGRHLAAEGLAVLRRDEAEDVVAVAVPRTIFAPTGATTWFPFASTSAISIAPTSPPEAFVSSVTMLATSGRSPTTNTRS